MQSKLEQKLLHILGNLKGGVITADEALQKIEQAYAEQWIKVEEELPDVECGSFLVYAPNSFPKNSRWLVAEYYDDVKGFYSESSENYLDDVTHWTKLPDEPKV